jgi:hypothetical protein
MSRNQAGLHVTENHRLPFPGQRVAQFDKVAIGSAGRQKGFVEKAEFPRLPVRWFPSASVPLLYHPDDDRPDPIEAQLDDPLPARIQRARATDDTRLRGSEDDLKASA